MAKHSPESLARARAALARADATLADPGSSRGYSEHIPETADEWAMRAPSDANSIGMWLRSAPPTRSEWIVPLVEVHQREPNAAERREEAERRATVTATKRAPAWLRDWCQ